MKFITEFFSALGSIISAIVDFIIDLFTGLADFFMSLPEHIEVIEEYMNLVPAEIKVFFVMVLSLSLIFVIIGRRGT